MSTKTIDVPSDSQCIDFLWEAGCKKRVVVHCATVRAVAEVIADGIPEADKDLVIAGALLHDIGRSKDHTIMHAYIGSQIAQKLGLCNELVEIIRKHTGAGLDQDDVKEFGLPAGDYMPSTLEEKIVAHADNMVSDNRVVSYMHSVDKLAGKGAQKGADRVATLHKELSGLFGRDLDTIIDEIGEYPKLKGVKAD
ncbi:MAG: HDIG domain-containing protein [archaeon]|nr:HDIG domain-containing protein [archaeon]